MNPHVKKAVIVLCTVLPLLSLIGQGVMYVDTRYMHKEISDTRYIDLQIRIIEGHIRDYERLKDTGANLNSSDESAYQTDLKQLDHLLKERQRMHGL